MKKALKELFERIESLALETVMLEPGDIPSLGEVLKSLEAMQPLLRGAKEDYLVKIIGAMTGFVERTILGEESDLAPFESGISTLQEIGRSLRNGDRFDKDISPLLLSLGVSDGSTPEEKPARVEKIATAAADVPKESQKGDVDRGKGKKGKKSEAVNTISKEDQEIVRDFVAESLESLESIEVKLMDLEQDPSDLETINAIFRPFHTIKGVSGFLNFGKINRLAHVVENLLDRARDGSINIDEQIIDLTLDSVDALKKMIEHVDVSLETGTPSEGDSDIDGLIDRVESLIDRAEKTGPKPIGEILVEEGVVSKTDLEAALEIQKEDGNKRVGEILVKQKKVGPKEAVSALREQKRLAEPVALQVKIDTNKLDNLVDMVGELAISQSILRQNDVIRTSTDRKLDHITNQLNQITSGLQKTAMSLRMVPIKNTFQKMLRLVRDLAKKGGKEAQLVMSGEDTEIDRNMVEEIYEPMVHMIRNSIDHGLELPQEREDLGKPRQGTIYLKAYHKGGDIVIEIADDGRGLNKDKILKKAISNGLIPEGEKLSEGEIHNLIFHPGFSTAEKITDISGRGVGMDVVKSVIVDKLRGRLDVESVPGEGMTTFIRLPLTLAIMDGMVIRVAGERFIIPTLNVQESFRPAKTECHTMNGGVGEMIMVRNRLVPLIRLDRLFGLNGNGSSGGVEKEPWNRLVVVVENQARMTCLLIDELLGQEEVVIKSLGGWLKKVRGIAGGAIMGDGRVSLILDIAGLFNMAFEE